MGLFRIAKIFEVEYGHRLSKHPEKCRFLHGHRLRIEIVVSGRELDANDMVCDYKALKVLVTDLVERLDHALALNSDDPELERLSIGSQRLLLFAGQDPTTEVVVRWLFAEIAARLGQDGQDGVVRSPSGVDYHIGRNLTLERVRVWETSTSWAEYAAG